jgi:DNA polymerase-1
MGVGPSQIVDYKALVGDPSDNYKGVPGIGPKTAVSLLEKYKTLDNIYKHIDELPDKLKEKLVTYKDSAYQSQKLAKIVTDVDIDFDLEKAKNWELDSDKVTKLFEQYGFRTLTRRVKEVGKAISDENQMSLL